LGILKWKRTQVEDSEQLELRQAWKDGVISSPLGLDFDRRVPRSLFNLNLDKPTFGELDGRDTVDGEATRAASTLVVDETRYGPEIVDVLILRVDFRFGCSSDTV
jgi:hypothetical protein